LFVSENNDNGESNLAGTVIKALDIVDCLAERRVPMSTQEIAKAVGMSRPTTYRLLMTLMSRGFVRDTGNFRFLLGTKLLTLSRLVLDQLDVLEVARPYLTELSRVSNETANLSILDDGELLYIGKEESRREVPMAVQLRSTVGTRIAVHSSAMGKAMLAFLPPESVQSYLDRMVPLKRYTAHTITSPEVLLRELEEVRVRGYAIDEREVDEGTRCVGAPVFDSSGQVAAAMSIAGPAYRLTLDSLHQFAGEVMRVTRELSRELGYVPQPDSRF
jgi:DNA-binding IclR family transcriptional regulator